MKLGKREIDDAACPPGQRDTIFFDEDLTGFALRVTKGGAKVFLFQYRVGSAVLRVRIGKYGNVTPAMARRRAEELRGLVVGGKDPARDLKAVVAAEKAEKAERARRKGVEALTFGALIGQWERLRLSQRRDKYRTEAVRALRFNLKQLETKAAASIDAAMARQAIHGISDAVAGRVASELAQKRAPRGPQAPVRGSTLTRRVHAYARAMYSWAIGRGLLESNPFAAVALEGRERPRERYLSDGELGEVWQACGVLGWPWGAYFRFLLLTLQRESETAGAAWAEISPDLALWELSGARTKNHRPHLVHLAAPARDILRHAQRVEGSKLIFTTTGRTPISGFSDAKERLDREISKARAKAAQQTGADVPPLTPWRLHDLRRTGVTVLARRGVGWEVADKLLNHAHGRINGVAAVYQRHEFLAEREAAINLWADHVLSAAAAGD